MYVNELVIAIFIAFESFVLATLCVLVINFLSKIESLKKELRGKDKELSNLKEDWTNLVRCYHSTVDYLEEIRKEKIDRKDE